MKSVEVQRLAALRKEREVALSEKIKADEALLASAAATQNAFRETVEGRRHAFEEQAELGAGLEVLIGGVPEILHPQLRQLPVDGGGNIY